MDNLQKVNNFNFLNNQIRVINQDNEIWFVLADVAKTLNLTNPSMIAQTLRENQKAKFNLGFGSDATIISESGLYRVLLRSDKPEAEKFQIWVEEDVLRSIRKHGIYATPLTVDAMLGNPDFAIELLTKFKAEQELRIKAEAEKEQIEKEKARLIHSDKTYTASELAKELNLASASKLNKILEEKHIQFKRNGTWILYAKYAEMGLTEIKQKELPSGFIVYDRKFTGKGRDFILNLLNELAISE